MKFVETTTPLVILTEGCFGESESKLALGVLRYGEWPVVAVLDSTKDGKTVREVTNLPCDAPIVATLEHAMAFSPKALLIGVAPAGGQLPPSWKALIKEAIQRGLHIINGLHFFLTETPELVALAQKHGVRLWDVRDPNSDGTQRFQRINQQSPRPANVQVITIVGSDCSVGKMHTALAFHQATQSLKTATQNLHSSFIATGQTGILISGQGVPLDRVIGDFMAGAIETCITETIEKPHPNPLLKRRGRSPNKNNEKSFETRHILWIEGQGSLLHPAYSGVTLSLLHGSNPDAMILCHKAGATSIRNYPQISIPPLKELARIYEQAAGWARPVDSPKARILGISVNTSSLCESDAHDYLKRIRSESGLPTTDPVRYGVDELLEQILKNCRE